MDDDTCLVDLVPSLSSFTFQRHELVEGTAELRLDFYEMAARRLAAGGVPTVFLERVGPCSYLARHCPGPPFEVVVKNRATGNSLNKYPGLFAEGQRFDPPVVKFDYRVDPDDMPIGDDYVRAAGGDVDSWRALALATNEILRAWLEPLELWDFCIIIGEGSDGRSALNSEVSPDCMRLRSPAGAAIDKDLFRRGASAEEICRAWAGLVTRLRSTPA
ncbi:MAG: SAICAR synthetase [Actinomycetota bacterium]|nr:SAICAR synthetase [Actinomycetota bacterium]